jgi:hypothetical protein
MLALVTNETADDVVNAATTFLDERGVPGEVRLLDADRRGLVVLSE